MNGPTAHEPLYISPAANREDSPLRCRGNSCRAGSVADNFQARRDHQSKFRFGYIPSTILADSHGIAGVNNPLRVAFWNNSAIGKYTPCRKLRRTDRFFLPCTVLAFVVTPAAQISCLIDGCQELHGRERLTGFARLSIDPATRADRRTRDRPATRARKNNEYVLSNGTEADLT